MSAPGFWEQLYADGGDGWELGGPAPPLLAWLDSGARLPAPAGEPARVAVPGCGRGHDARLLAQRGYRAWGFDFAVAAVSAARASAAGLDVTYAQRDVFALGPEYRGYFDAVWEYTCYCAIDPARRGEYARVLGEIVRPGGTLLACFFPLREGGGRAAVRRLRARGRARAGAVVRDRGERSPVALRAGARGARAPGPRAAAGLTSPFPPSTLRA